MEKTHQDSVIAPVVEAQMLIRKPVDEVFNAFIDPLYTTHFWFTKSSGSLEEGKTVVWEWEMYDVSSEVHVSTIRQNEIITISWDKGQTTIDFLFESKSASSTYVIIRQTGFKSIGTDLLAEVIDATGGFTTVLDGMKAYLEHGIDLNLIGDKFATK